MRCFLHVGVEKTGTTSIQRFLGRNRAVLRGSGLLVPELTGRCGHSALCVACSKRFRDDDLCRHAGVADEDGWRGYRAMLGGLLAEEIREAKAEGVSALVISSEHIQSRLTAASEIRNLRALLAGAGVTEVRVIVYLRDPAEIAASLFSTAVKFGSTAQGPPAPSNGYFRNVCDHKRTIGRFVAAFGWSKVEPRIFAREDLRNGSVVDDFAEVLGCGTRECEPPADESNPALSGKGIRVLARINESVPVFVDGVYNMERERVLRLLESRFADVPYRLSPGEMRAYDEEFAASNEWVRAVYFPQRSSLFERNSAGIRTVEDESDSEIGRAAAAILEELRAAG